MWVEVPSSRGPSICRRLISPREWRPEIRSPAKRTATMTPKIPLPPLQQPATTAILATHSPPLRRRRNGFRRPHHRCPLFQGRPPGRQKTRWIRRSPPCQTGYSLSPRDQQKWAYYRKEYLSYSSLDTDFYPKVESWICFIMSVSHMFLLQPRFKAPPAANLARNLLTTEVGYLPFFIYNLFTSLGSDGRYVPVPTLPFIKNRIGGTVPVPTVWTVHKPTSNNFQGLCN